MSTVPVRTLLAEPMTAGAFAPFGLVFGRDDAGPAREDRMLAFAHTGRATLGTIWNPAGDCGFSRLERHFGVTQGFVQISGAPSVVCVAEPTDLDDPGALPDPAAVRAFLIDPGQGYLFHRGTWHSLDRYPLEPPGATFLIVNSDPNPTQIADFALRSNQMHEDLGAGAPPESLPYPDIPACRFQIGQ